MWILFWIESVILLIAVLLLLLARRGVPCILCDIFSPHKPEFGPVRAPPRRGSVRIPSDVYKRPDPLIYSQQFLIAQGLAVTWDNPDIWIETVGSDNKPSGIVIPSHQLTADTDYFVIARIWNGSVDAPAIDLPVHFSFLSFGIGMTSTPIGIAQVDLAAKGIAGCPAFAPMRWRTPSVPGHYCLQVRLVWPDDAEPGNNLGQENTDVKALNSPHATFTFPVRNDSGLRRVLRLEADSYQLRERPQCSPDHVAPTNPHLSTQEIVRQRRLAKAEHGRGGFAFPADWAINLPLHELDLGPGEEEIVTVDVTAPDGFLGQQAININAFVGERLSGGVTLYVTGDGH